MASKEKKQQRKPKQRTLDVNEDVKEASMVSKSGEHWACLQDWGDVSRFQTQLDACSFGHLLLGHNSIPKLNHLLLEALCTFFSFSTFSFEFNKDVSIHYGLLDVLFITGLNIDGEAVTGVETNEDITQVLEDFVSTSVCSQLKSKSKGSVTLSSLNKLNKEELSDEDCLKLFCFQSIGAVISPNSSSSIPHMYIPLLKNVHGIKNIAWGAAMLAAFQHSIRRYLETCKERKSRRQPCKSQLHGPFLPFIVFLCEMIPKFATLMGVTGDFLPTEFPLMKQWTKQLFRPSHDMHNLHSKEYYIEFFKNLRREDIILHNYERRGLNNVPERVRKQIPIAAAIVPVLNFEMEGRNCPQVNPERFNLSMQKVNNFLDSMGTISVQPRKQRSGTKPEGGERLWDNRFGDAKARWDQREKFIMKADEDEFDEEEPLESLRKRLQVKKRSSKVSSLEVEQSISRTSAQTHTPNTIATTTTASLSTTELQKTNETEMETNEVDNNMTCCFGNPTYNISGKRRGRQDQLNFYVVDNPDFDEEEPLESLRKRLQAKKMSPKVPVEESISRTSLHTHTPNTIATTTTASLSRELYKTNETEMETNEDGNGMTFFFGNPTFHTSHKHLGSWDRPNLNVDNPNFDDLSSADP